MTKEEKIKEVNSEIKRLRGIYNRLFGTDEAEDVGDVVKSLKEKVSELNELQKSIKMKKTTSKLVNLLTPIPVKLKEAHKYCNDNDKSTEFMLEYMQDYAGATLDEVLEYLQAK